MVGSAGVGVTPDPSHWKTGVPVTPLGRVTEQVRVTVSPAIMDREEEVREMMAGSEERYCQCIHYSLAQYTYSDIRCSSHSTG